MSANGKTKLSDAVAYLADGNYYLSADLALGGQPIITAGANIKVCLNGHQMTGSRCVLTFNEAQLSIYDCSEGEVGSVTGTTGSQGGNWARYNGLSIYGGNFVNCKAGTYGAGLASDGKNVNIYGGKFDGNEATQRGGNFALNGASTWTVKDTKVINGKAGLSGGNIYMSGAARLTLDNVTVSGGTVNGAAEDIYLENGALLTLLNMPEGSKIYIRMANPGVFTANVVPAGYEKMFVAVNEGLSITRNSEGKLMMTEHTHCVCGGLIENGHEFHTGISHTCSDVKWTAWTSETKLPQFEDLAEGDNYFYLTKDVNISGDYRPALTSSGYVTDMAGRKIYICLNGHTVKQTGRFISTLADYSNSIVTQLTNLDITITDCKETPGTITWSAGRNFGSNQGSFAWLAGANTHVTLYNGIVDASSCKTSSTRGGLVSVSASGCVFDMYGGTMKPMSCETTSSQYIYGMAVAIYSTGKFNMYGGEITGGKITGAATWSVGGNVYVSDATSTMNMYGGTITKGTATHGGNIAIEKGTVNIYGGEVSEGTAAYANGGNILNNRGTLNVYDGTITKGNAQTNGGNIANSYTDASNYGTFRMYGGTVSNGNAFSNNKNDTHGGNIWTCGKAYITGGTITGGTAKENVSKANSATGAATQGYGGNIYVRGGVFELSGAETVVSNGNAAVGGGGIYFLAEQTANPITATVSGGTFTGNYSWSGGAIALSFWSGAGNTVTIEGNTKIENNTCSATGYGAGIQVYSGNLIVKGTPTFSNNKSTKLASDIFYNTAETTKSIDVSGYTGTSKIKLARGTSETALSTGIFGTAGTLD